MSLSEIHSFVDEYMLGMNHSFVELSLICKSAIEKNLTLLTLQIGGMNGVSSNDPMHKIFKELDSFKLVSS
jgi:hypothetical protein